MIDQMTFAYPSAKHKSTLVLGENPEFGAIADPDRPVKAVSLPDRANISAGKNTYVYDAHTYHTKVPPAGIKLLIEHFTNPGDVVLDPFCGSGMTGVAAAELERGAMLSDLSPAAVFIAYNLNTPIDDGRYMNAVGEIMRRSKDLEGVLYKTHCRECGKSVTSLYTVWSYGLLCNLCNREFVLWDVARDEKESVRESKILAEFECPHCHEIIKKRGLTRTKRYPVQIGYKCCKRSNKEEAVPLTHEDIELIGAIEVSDIPEDLWYPKDEFPLGINTRQPIAAGLTSVDKCYTPRALHAMAYLWNECSKWPETEVRDKLLFTLTSLYKRVTLFSEFRFWGGSGNIANYNVPAIINEQNVFRTFFRKAKTISWYFRESASTTRQVQISTQSACSLHQVRDKSIDYVFTDVPFGGNINYSEMNFLWESWLRRFTNADEEAIVNRVQGKDYDDYSKLLQSAFCEVSRVLKDRAWMTVVFHNSSKKAWAAIQEALIGSGFSISGTQTFDKEHGTFKMHVSENAVGYDLVLHCQKSEDRPRALRTVSDSREKVLGYIRSRITSDEVFEVSYQHVDRKSNFDYRRLYADWLALVLPEEVVDHDFESFRELVDTVRREPDA